MLPYIDVLNRLEHTRYHSGQDLANVFGVTRATIHNCILRLVSMGIPIDRVRGKGYRLMKPLDLLDKAAIKSKLTTSVREKLTQFQIMHELGSTNDYMATQELPKAGCFSVAMAEMQTSGKGRRGRHWESPYAANIYMSVLWPLQKSMSEVGALSPLLSIGILQSLKALGMSGLGLKWPNDIYCHNKKLAGLLIQCSGEVSGTSKMIIGIGVNVYMSQQESVNIDQDWTDIVTHSTTNEISRNEVAANLLNHVVSILDTFERKQVDNLVGEWAQWDILKDKPVMLHKLNENIKGVARGIDEHGYLLLETNNQIQHISAGDVSLRAQL